MPQNAAIHAMQDSGIDHFTTLGSHIGLECFTTYIGDVQMQGQSVQHTVQIGAAFTGGTLLKFDAALGKKTGFIGPNK